MIKLQKSNFLRQLRALYGYDVALLKQRGGDIGDEDAELESLALYHLNIQIINAFEEFFGYVGTEPDMQSGAIAVAMGAAGNVAGVMANHHGKKIATKAIKLGQKYFTLQYTKTLERKR